MKGKLKDNIVSKSRAVSGDVHLHLEGEFANGTAQLEYLNDAGSFEIITGQDETNYSESFTAGQGYAPGDSITLNDGSDITVDAITYAPWNANLDQYNGGTLTAPWVHANVPAIMGTTDGYLAVIQPDGVMMIDVTAIGFPSVSNNAVLEYNARYASDTGTQRFVAHLMANDTSPSNSSGWRFEMLIEPGSTSYRLFRNSDVVVDTITVARVIPQTIRFEINGPQVNVFADGNEVINFNDGSELGVFGSYIGFTNSADATAWVGVQDIIYTDRSVAQSDTMGEVAEFTVVSSGLDRDVLVGRAYEQLTTTGNGTGFSVTPRNNNVQKIWRPIAGEDYTSPTDKFLHFPIGTVIRLSLSGAGGTTTIYTWQVDLSQYNGITGSGDPVTYNYTGPLEFDVFWNGEWRRATAWEDAAHDTIGDARFHIANQWVQTLNAAAGADIARTFDRFGDGSDWTFRIESETDFNTQAISAGLEFITGTSSPEDGPPLTPDVFYEVRQ